MNSDSATNIKNNFSAFLDRVKRGETVIVCEYGRPIAQITKPVLNSGSNHLLSLEREGLVSFPQKKSLKVKEFLANRLTLSKKVSLVEALLKDRSDSI